MLGGTHVMVDLYGAADPGEDTRKVLEDVAKLANLNVLTGVEHIFPSGGYGRTTMLLLSESHTSIHTWPENRYVAFDLFSCRDLTADQVDKVTRYVKAATAAKDARVKIAERRPSLGAALGGLGEIPAEYIGPLVIASAILLAPAIGIVTGYFLKKVGIRA